MGPLSGLGCAQLTPAFPHDSATFPTHTRALLAHLRRGRFDDEADPKIARFVQDDMPADLKALLHTWAHMPGARYVELGEWRLDGARLAPATNAVDGMEYGDPDDAIDTDHAVCVGDNGRFPLVAKWSATATACSLVGVDAEYGKVHYLGKLKDLVADAIQAHHDRRGEDAPIPGDLGQIAALAR